MYKEWDQREKEFPTKKYYYRTARLLYRAHKLGFSQWAWRPWPKRSETSYF